MARVLENGPPGNGPEKGERERDAAADGESGPFSPDFNVASEARFHPRADGLTSAVRLHCDGTYELFRATSAAASAGTTAARRRDGGLSDRCFAARGARVTHVDCAFDHVIEYFRNDLTRSKNRDGIARHLAQFELVERAAKQ